jgi:hypothetical protein
VRIRPLSFFIAITLVALLSSLAQQGDKKSAITTVTGHPYCADTNAPARLASVMLEPVRAVDASSLTVSVPEQSVHPVPKQTAASQ